MNKTLLCFDMLEDYVVDINDETIHIEAKRWKNRSSIDKIIIAIHLFFSPVMVAGFSIFFFFVVRELNFYTVVFPTAALLGFVLNTHILINKINCSNKFRAIIDLRGITYGSSNKTFFIPWEKVESFGLVNKVWRASPMLTLKYRTYSCIYVSTSKIDTHSLRKKFQKQLSSSMELRNTEEYFLFAFIGDCDENKESQVCEKFLHIILKFVDAQKEISDFF